MVECRNSYDAWNLSFAPASHSGVSVFSSLDFVILPSAIWKFFLIVQTVASRLHRRGAAFQPPQPRPLTTDTILNQACFLGSLTTVFLRRCTAFSSDMPQTFPCTTMTQPIQLLPHKAQTVESLKLCIVQYFQAHEKHSPA
ncbi:hypothetical protein N431DRAFT_164995 [Stipitochalara longipes BDJ]|nr:hypothetical protein N431DRAFT_164995 [Stipitochalara longipes BDJ]